MILKRSLLSIYLLGAESLTHCHVSVWGHDICVFQEVSRHARFLDLVPIIIVQRLALGLNRDIPYLYGLGGVSIDHVLYLYLTWVCRAITPLRGKKLGRWLGIIQVGKIIFSFLNIDGIFESVYIHWHPSWKFSFFNVLPVVTKLPKTLSFQL